MGHGGVACGVYSADWTSDLITSLVQGPVPVIVFRGVRQEIKLYPSIFIHWFKKWILATLIIAAGGNPTMD